MSSSKQNSSIYIRPEIFDHLIYPLSVKLDDEKIISLFRKLHVISAIDFTINFRDWMNISMEYGISQLEANVIFDTFCIFQGYVNKTPDVRIFGLCFVLQLYIQRSRISLNIDRNEKYAYLKSSPLSSPRGKSIYGRQGNNIIEYQNEVNFVKDNVKLFLRIISSDIHNTETTINENEFNTLRFLFFFEKEKKISEIFRFFENLPPVTKINVNIISEIINKNINVKLGDIGDYFRIKGLSKCVTIKNSECQNKNILISNCDDSYIYINTNVVCCKISCCVNCTIFVAVSSKIISIEKCEKCNISIISNFTRISNIIDSSIFLYTCYEPILFGDNRGLKLGPFNAVYNDLFSHIKESKININQNNIKNFSNPRIINGNKEQFSIIQPEDFTQLVTPFEYDSNNANNNNIDNDNKSKLLNKLCPFNYCEILENRKKNYIKIKEMVKQAGFQENQEKAFHVALQGYFREWLVSSGNYKPMSDLVKMIDEPYGLGPLNSK